MPSSTSSSSARSWAQTWIAVLVVVGSCIAAWELTWRSRGFEPELNDDAGLWALARRRAEGMGPEGVALVGSSRIQMGIDEDVLRESGGFDTVVQLATTRGPSLPILASLAHDESFRGTVVVEINPVLVFAKTMWYFAMFDERYIAHYESAGWSSHLEQWLRMGVQGALVSRLPALAPNQLWTAFAQGRAPRPREGTILKSTRFRERDYRKIRGLAASNAQVARSRAQTVMRPLDTAAFAARRAEIEAMVSAIHERGGRVVFVRMPSALHIRKNERHWYPRAQWWDVFAAETSAKAIHFEDVPELARVVPQDGEHLDIRDAKRLSRVLGRLLSAGD